MDDQTPELPSMLDNAPEERPINIKLIGVGGAGINAVSRLSLATPMTQVKLAAIDTDSQALASLPVGEKLLIGRGITFGLSAGAEPEHGRLAAESEREAITAMVRNSQLVILVAGMGRGTGSGAAPVVAEAASKAGALVIAFVPLPFTFEGPARTKMADEALVALRAAADAVIPLPNDMLMQEDDVKSGVLLSFARSDEWIDRAVRSLWSMLYRPGLINLDFAALREAFTYRGGKTLYGLGFGEGDDPVGSAMADFVECPMLHTPEHARKADRLLVNITGGTDLSLSDVQEIMAVVTEKFGREPHVTMGAVIDESWNHRVEICVIGTTDLNGRGTRRVQDRTARARDTARRNAAQASARAAETELGLPIMDLGEPTPRGRAIVAARNTWSSPAQGVFPASSLSRRPSTQEEFAFADMESRGRFEDTMRTFFEGEDLDLPTYRRRGIKLML